MDISNIFGKDDLSELMDDAKKTAQEKGIQEGMQQGIKKGVEQRVEKGMKDAKQAMANTPLDKALDDLGTLTDRTETMIPEGVASQLKEGLSPLSPLIKTQEDTPFPGTLKIGNRTFMIVDCTYKFTQTVDTTGKPSSRPRGGAITFIMPSLSDESMFFYRWMFSKTEVQSGYFKFMVYTTNNKKRYKTLCFKNAYCTELQEHFNDNDHLLMRTTVTISAEKITMGSNDTAEYDNEWT